MSPGELDFISRYTLRCHLEQSCVCLFIAEWEMHQYISQHDGWSFQRHKFSISFNINFKRLRHQITNKSNFLSPGDTLRASYFLGKFSSKIKAQHWTSDAGWVTYIRALNYISSLLEVRSMYNFLHPLQFELRHIGSIWLNGKKGKNLIKARGTHGTRI